MRFEFATATRILFGTGVFQELGQLVSRMGSRTIIVTARFGSDTLLDILARDNRILLDQLHEQEISSTLYAVEGEPSISSVEIGAQIARDADADIVIAIGGGSAIDTGKAIAALLANGGKPLDYLEVIGRGKPITKPSLPLIAVPTTAGTGAEVTRNAVLASPEHRTKVSLRSPFMLPRLALIDPELTYTLPPAVTAATGLDALTQVIEPYLSNRANPLTDAICREGIVRAARSLRRAYHDGQDANAREDMSIASLFGGLALANAKLGAVHGFAGVLGGTYHAPHGAICACLLPHVMTVNVRTLLQRQPGNPVLDRYREVAQMVTGDPKADIDDGVRWIQDLVLDLDIAPLSTFGITADDRPLIIEKAQQASSMKGNPILLTAGELDEILTRALD